MFEKFGLKESMATRAAQVWPILIGGAHNRQIITYGILADILGFGGAGVFNKILGHIMYFCKENGLPSLTVLVVNQKDGKPGLGLHLLKPEDVSREREKVFNFPWYRHSQPTAKELAEAWDHRA